MGIINLILGGAGAAATTGATGGNSISYAPGPAGPTHYAVHKFTASGSLVVNTVASGAAFEYIVVGGGGGGGGDSLGSGTPQGRGVGGGGAGGFRSNLPEGPGGPSPTAEAAYPITTGTYPVVIGGGGAAGTSGSYWAQQGSFSSFGVSPQTVIRSEGGGASGIPNEPGNYRVGGSGSGGTWYDQDGPQAGGEGNHVTNRDGGGESSPAPNQGYPGGSGRTSGNQGKGGGGGGAEAQGQGANQNESDTYGINMGGHGGEGRATLIFGPTTGPTNQIAGGGGGSRGGEGVYGGGDGPNDSPGANGTANTGGGGGGSGGSLSSGGKNGGTGGSGLVVIRYAQGS